MIITQLKIYTKNLEEQETFYKTMLGIDVIDKTDTSVTFKIGYTDLILCYSESAKPYHFAINIPSNKEQEALVWLKKRLTVLQHQGHELIDFPNWNAKSIYFYDADKNIVEFIARKNLKIETSASFDTSQLLGVSEIGIAVNNVGEIYRKINAIQKTDLYFGNLDLFCAAGDEHGLFIIIDQRKKGWMPCNDPAYTADFEIKGDINFEFVKGEIRTNV